MNLQPLETAIAELPTTERRILLFGESGIGKSTLARKLANESAGRDRPCFCLSADPGSPAFGPPGTVCLAQWRDNDWQPLRFEALCTLDAGRFRLPLVSAAARLAGAIRGEFFLVDAPGLVRGVAGAELLSGLAEAAEIDTVLVLARDESEVPLVHELEAIPAGILGVRASLEARYPGVRRRSRERTYLWDKHLEKAEEREIKPEARLLNGTPPPLDAREYWRGRQIAFLKERRTLALGEVMAPKDDAFIIRIEDFSETPDQILIRDAYRNEKNRLTTAKPWNEAGLHYLPPPDISPYAATGKKHGPHPLVRIGEAGATLINGIFGDPLLHMRLHNRKRSVLFDLGEGNRLTAHLAHQVTDIFISHGHMDHISGFLWLMRSRIGKFPACSLYGPPGLAERIAHLINGILWDRAGDWGPIFTVKELHDRELITYRLQAGEKGGKELGTENASEGIILKDKDITVRAATLDHAATPVLAYSLEQAPKLSVKKDKLKAMNLPAGPWLGDLKDKIGAGTPDSLIRLPDRREEKAGTLARELLEITPARKLVYATDLGDIPTNREKLIELAAGAHVFFCEAGFIEKDGKQAKDSGHLTARACGEIARSAGVGLLIPFHFSRRYEKNVYQVYDEIKIGCPRLLQPTPSEG